MPSTPTKLALAVIGVLVAPAAATEAPRWNVPRTESPPTRLERPVHGTVIARRCDALPAPPVETRLSVRGPDAGCACTP